MQPSHVARIVCRFAVVAALLAVPRGVAAAPTTVEVTVDAADVVGGRNVRVLAWDAKLKALRPTETQALIDNTGRAEVALEPGTYVFEVLEAEEHGLLIAVRSDRVRVPRQRSVALKAAAPVPVRLTHEGSELVVREVGVRSAAMAGEARWRRRSDGSAPQIVLTAGEPHRVSVLASAGDVHAAGWFKAQGGEPADFRTERDWRTCRFAWRPGTPAVRAATATLNYPESRQTVPVTDATRLITNRAWCTMQYDVELEAGPRLAFRPNAYALKRSHVFELGGELTAGAWAAYVSTQESPERWTPNLDWRVELWDPQRHTVDIDDKRSGVTWRIERRDGGEFREGAVDDAYKKSLGDLTRALRVHVAWEWGGPQSAELSPRGYAEVRSRQFRMEAVPLWEWPTRNYLTKLERYIELIRRITGRRGPLSVNVDWRSNTHNARATVGSAQGGGQWLWCSLPFHGYEDNHDPFSEPWFLGHELLHNFGYHHGEEMARLQQECEFAFAAFRWHVADHPELVLPLEQARLYEPSTSRRRR